MSRTISEIYTEYKIMPSLQMHMLRVAALASKICDNYNGQINKEEIITACLLHDMGNIIKSNLQYFPDFIQPEGLEYWQHIKDEYLKKYGTDEHHATLEIMRKIGIDENIVMLVDGINFSRFCRHRDNENLSMKIIIYSDARVDPHGIVSYHERLNESKVRYKNRKNSVSEEERQKLIACGQDIEKQIFAHCAIQPEDITNESVVRIIAELKNFVIK